MTQHAEGGAAVGASTPNVTVRAEHLAQAFGIGTASPRLSWVIETSTRDWRQTAYEIQAFGADGAGWGGTGRVESDRSSSRIARC